MALRMISNPAVGSKSCCTTAESMRAVSYTHLDVYKRQSFICSMLLMPESTIIMPGKHAAKRMA